MAEQHTSTMRRRYSINLTNNGNPGRRILAENGNTFPEIVRSKTERGSSIFSMETTHKESLYLSKLPISMNQIAQGRVTTYCGERR